MSVIPPQKGFLEIPCEKCDSTNLDPTCPICKGTGKVKIEAMKFTENATYNDQLDIVIKYKQKIKNLKNIIVLIIILSILSSFFSFISINEPEIGFLSLVLSFFSTITSIIGFFISPDPNMVDSIKVPISHTKKIPFFQKQ